MSMFGPRSGSWWIHSDSDRRWNRNGRCDVGGFLMPIDCKKLIEELTSLYGTPPADLEYGYMKD